MADARLHWVDHAKAIGIVLVVVGHTSMLPGEAREFIYRFHMPLFFFLAGVLTKPERLAEGFRPWLGRQARALVIPYLGFFAVSWLWWLLIRNIGEKARETAGLAWWAPLKGLVWGTGESLFVNPPLWFFPALFMTSVAFWGLWRATRGTRAGLVAVGVVALLGLNLWWPRSMSSALPWNVDLVPWLLILMTLGFWLRPRLLGMKPAPWVVGLLAGLGVIILAQAWMAAHLVGLHAPAPLDINGRMFEGDRGFSAMAAAVRSLAVVFLVLAIPANPLTARLARDTIVIFPLHGLWFSVFTGVLTKVFHRGDWKTTGGWAAVAVYTLGAIVLSLAVAPLLRRWVPWLVGGR